MDDVTPSGSSTSGVPRHSDSTTPRVFSQSGQRWVGGCHLAPWLMCVLASARCPHVNVSRHQCRSRSFTGADRILSMASN